MNTHATSTLGNAARLVVAVAATASLAVPVHAAVASPRTSSSASSAVVTTSVPSAMTIAERMARHKGVVLLNLRVEGPHAVVRGGLCTHVSELGCQQMVATKDASVMVFGTAKQADDYVGGADDTASAHGRMVLSFGSPTRVRPAGQKAYGSALRDYRRTHRAAMPDAVRAATYLASKGLLMREAHLEDSGGIRWGRAAEIPGAVDMVGSSNADVIVFADRDAAAEYVGNADDLAYRVRRFVLSFGSPARVHPSVRPTYKAAFREALS